MNQTTKKYQIEALSTDKSSTKTLNCENDSTGSQYFIGNGNLVSLKVDPVSGAVANNEVLYTKL